MCIEKKSQVISMPGITSLFWRTSPREKRPVGHLVARSSDRGWAGIVTIIAAEIRGDNCLIIYRLEACFPLAAQHTHTIRSGNSGRLYFKVVITSALQPCSLQTSAQCLISSLTSNITRQSPGHVRIWSYFCLRVLVLLTISWTRFLVKASTHTNIQVLIIPLDLCLRICTSRFYNNTLHSQLNTETRTEVTLQVVWAGPGH